MKRERTMSQYTVEVDLLKIMDLDFKHEECRDWDNTLFHHLDKIKGVDEVDYNGHFGNVVFLNVDAMFDNPETWETIEKTITDYMETK